jgi:hypothetical protein
MPEGAQGFPVGTPRCGVRAPFRRAIVRPARRGRVIAARPTLPDWRFLLALGLDSLQQSLGAKRRRCSSGL